MSSTICKWNLTLDWGYFLLPFAHTSSICSHHLLAHFHKPWFLLYTCSLFYPIPSLVKKGCTNKKKKITVNSPLLYIYATYEAFTDKINNIYLERERDIYIYTSGAITYIGLELFHPSFSLIRPVNVKALSMSPIVGPEYTVEISLFTIDSWLEFRLESVQWEGKNFGCDFSSSSCRRSSPKNWCQLESLPSNSAVMMRFRKKRCLC